MSLKSSPMKGIRDYHVTYSNASVIMRIIYKTDKLVATAITNFRNLRRTLLDLSGFPSIRLRYYNMLISVFGVGLNSTLTSLASLLCMLCAGDDRWVSGIAFWFVESASVLTETWERVAGSKVKGTKNTSISGNVRGT
jgi:hypothetical protein